MSAIEVTEIGASAGPFTTDKGMSTKLGKPSRSSKSKGLEEAETWMYHSPHKKPLHPVAAPALSQISMAPDFAPAQPSRPKFSATDTTYVKLAKSGGRRDLLTYTEKGNTSRVRVNTSWPEWMDHDGATEAYLAESRRPVAIPEKPDWVVHEEHSHADDTMADSSGEAAYKMKVPFSMEDQSHSWNREKEDSLKLPQISTRRHRPKQITGRVNGPPWGGATARQQQRPTAKRLPKLVEDKGEVSMTHLLANGYQDDWLRRRQNMQQQDTAKQEQLRAERRRIVHRAQNTRRAVTNQSNDASSKPVFKLSRFANVPSRVKYYMGGE